VLRIGGVNVTALHTPGHAPDHLAFWLDEDRVAFTGDLVLGQGSTMITYPEGDVRAYLESLDRLAALKPRILFPGHWDPVENPSAKLGEYRRHRLEREAQVLEEVRRGPGTAAELTRRVYESEVGDNAQLLAAAEMTLRAHLKKLVEDDAVAEEGETYTARG
jgi:glyoxylase-like metal-dependent hydrolase (beta-lactamase superfamily II)